MTKPIRITRIEGYAFRSPLAKPVATSFGIMRDRPAVFLRLEDQDGAFGWGEVFANWPSAAAEHRVALLERDIGPLVLETPCHQPSDLFQALSRRTHVVALQSGEWGPFRQVIAGLDVAIWDLFARKSAQSLRRYMNETSVDQVPAYASGIHIKDAAAMIDRSRQIGFQSFKVKVGFDLAEDLTGLRHAFDAKSDGETLAADANQAWDLETALHFARETAALPLSWLEEPLRADAPADEWATLRTACHYPLAGGENIVGFEDFSRIIDAKLLRVIQPDIIKWGGLTGCLAVAQSARGAGLTYCPHFLGGGIGLQASANLLAAVGGDGLLEVDVNPNPLRDAFAPVSSAISSKGWHCNGEPGLGVTRLPESIAQFQTQMIEVGR